MKSTHDKALKQGQIVAGRPVQSASICRFACRYEQFNQSARPQIV